MVSSTSVRAPMCHTKRELGTLSSSHVAALDPRLELEHDVGRAAAGLREFVALDDLADISTIRYACGTRRGGQRALRPGGGGAEVDAFVEQIREPSSR